MDEALKPCPAECLHTVDRGGPSLFRRRGDIFGVYCQTCQCSTEYYSTEAEAITAWNTRADAAPTPKADEVKAVARAVHGELSHIDVMKYLDMPDNTADRVAQAAIAALDAARDNAEPVAWRYEHHATGERSTTVFATYAWQSGGAGWIETPLYAHPPVPDAARGDPVARVVEWLRAMKRDDTNWPQHIALRIERGEPFNAD